MTIKLTCAIKDIMKVIKCDAELAQKIETHINDGWMIDWSRDSQRKINSEIRFAHTEMLEEGIL